MPANRPTVVEVRRTETTCTYLWDAPPTQSHQYKAQRRDPPARPCVGHCWPGNDQTHARVLIPEEAF